MPRYAGRMMQSAVSNLQHRAAKGFPIDGGGAADGGSSMSGAPSGGAAGGGGTAGTTGGGTTSGDLTSLFGDLRTDYEEARAAKQKRYEEGIGILQSVVEQFGPGYLKGEEKQTLAAMEQGMVGRGLGGTTRPAAVGTGIKADIRDRATKGRVGAMTNVAQYMAGFQDTAPTPGTLASLATSMEALRRGTPSAPPSLIGAGMGSEPGGPAYMANAVNLMNPALATERTTGPGPGVASATTSFGPTAPPATGAGATTYGASESWWRGVQS